MSYTAQSIITMAQRLLLDVDDDAYADDMLSYFNEWQRRFASETHCCLEEKEVAVTSNLVSFSTIAASITGADELLHIFRLRYDSGTQYAFLPKAKITDQKDLPATTVTAPTRFWLFGKKLIFDLHPSATISFNATVSCSYTPDDLALGDTTLIPSQWAQAGVKYLEYCARVTDRDAGLANGAFAEYEAIRLAAAAFYKGQMEL